MIEEPAEQLRGAELSQIIGSANSSSVGLDSPDSDKDALSKRLMAMARAAVIHANSTDLGRRRGAMARSNESYRNEHNYRSKYAHKNYSARSRLFIPKTRSAVKNKLVAIRAALFSTDDAVTITAEDDTDPDQQASAELNHALINYRFDRSTGRKAGIPWVKMALGAGFDVCVAGISVAKTSWEFQEKIEEGDEEEDPETGQAQHLANPALPPPSADPNVDLTAGVPQAAPPPGPMDPNAPPMGADPSMGGGMPPPQGMPPMDTGMLPPGMPPMGTGMPPPQPMPPMGTGMPPPTPNLPMMPPMGGGMPMPMDMGESEELNVVGMNGLPVQRKILRDKPMIYHIEPENVIVDMAAPWWDVFQDGQFLIVKHPMKVGDVKAMMKPGSQHMGGGPWFEIPDKVMANAINDTSNTGVRTSRTGNEDRYGRSAQPSVNDFEVVWVHENFVRVDGIDYHFWSLGTRHLLSEPGETGEVGHYPAHRGERPYVMGVGSIEPHVAIPMSHVEAWRPLQDEINDSTNLRIDAMKQAIAPITLYRMGANVDLRAVRERGPDATIGVSDLDKDIRFQPIQGPNATIYAEMDRLNSQFDELAGSFATSTVQSSRAIGETARGMQLVSSAANTTQDFDLAVFLETWAEPVIRHIVWLEQYYETDQNLLSLLAKKGNLYQRFGADLILDEILDRQLTTKISIGPGAGDPVQKLQRINAAVDVSMKVAPMVMGQVQPKAEELFAEIWASTGVSAARIFTFTSPEEAEQKMMEQQQQAQENDPNKMKIEAQMHSDQMKIQAQQESDQRKADLDAQRLELEKEKQQVDLQLAQEKNQVEREKLELERQKIAAEIDALSQESSFKQQSLQQDQTFKQQGFEQEQSIKERQFAEQQRQADREHQATNQLAQQELGFREREFANKDREFAATQAAADRNAEQQQRDSQYQQAVAERDFQHQQRTGQQDFGLRAAAHNKQMIDEATAQAQDTLTPQQAREPLPMETAMEQAAQSLMQSTNQLTQTLTMLAQTQQQSQQVLIQMMQAMQAPKRVVYGEDGRVQGVEHVNGEAT
jgi:hypothetical protein